MKKAILLYKITITAIICVYIVNSASSQIISNGGTVSVISSGLVVNGGTLDNNSGTFTNNGTLTLSGDVLNDSILGGNGTFNVGGNWANNGTFNAGTSTVNFNGTSSSTISASNFNNININGTGSVTGLGAITATGNFTIGSGSTFIAGAFTHNVAGNWSNSGTFNATGSTINFNGSSTSTITAGNFNNINISSTGTVTGLGAITAAGNFNLSSGYFDFQSPVLNSITIGGNYTQSGGTFDFNTNTSGNSYMSLGGNFTQTSASQSMTTSGAGALNGIITFNGSGTQTLSFAYPDGAIWVVYSIPSGNSVKLLSNIELNLADGVSQIGFQGEINVNGTLDLGTSNVSGIEVTGVPGTGVFRIYPGAKLITANSGGISGAISSTNMTTTLSSGANYEFQGAATGTFTTTPAANTVNNLIINNSSNVALTNSITVADSLLLTKGKFTLSADTLTLAGSSPVITSGTIDATATGATNKFSGAASQNIPSGTFYNNNVYNLIVNNPNNVIIYDTLNLLNNLSVTSGRLDAFTNTPTVSYAGNSSQNIDTSQYLNDKIYNLIINNSSGVTLNTDLTINNNLNINSGKSFAIASINDLTVTGTITNSAGTSGFILQSDTNGTASLLHNTNNVPATVQRYISGADEAWHFLSTPVTGQGISGSWLPSGTYGNGTGYDMYVWNEPTSCWIYQLNTTSPVNWNTVHPDTSFDVGRGYLISYQAANPTKQFIGNLNNGSVNYSLTDNSTDVTLQGFNFVGNPYPSSIDWQATSGWSRSNLVTSGSGYDMWIWNSTANNYGVCNSATGSVGTNDITRYIAPMQGFFVLASSVGNISTNNAVRLNNNSSGDGWFKDISGEPVVSVVVQSGVDNSFDEARLMFGHTNSETGAAKLFSHVVTAPSLYIPYSNKNYSVRYLTDTADYPMVPIYFKAGIDGTYTIKCNFDPGNFKIVMLEDRLMHFLQDIKIKNTYTFQSSTSDDASRFILHFGPDNNAQYNNELPARIYGNGSQLVIDLSLLTEETDVSVYNTLGQLLLHTTIQGGTLDKLNLNVTSQIIIVYLKNTQGTLCKKIYYNNQ